MAIIAAIKVIFLPDFLAAAIHEFGSLRKVTR